MDFDSHDWTDNLACPWSPQQVAEFQAQLDAIVGTEPNGVKRWRLMWGPDSTAWVWNRYYNNAEGRWEPKPELYWGDAATEYRNVDAKPGELDTLVVHEPIAVPRFWIGALLPRAHRDALVDAAGQDADGQAYSKRKYRGEEYAFMISIHEHSLLRDKDTGRPLCCSKLWRERDVPCKGAFRFPDEADLRHLREEFQQRMARKLGRPDEPLSTADRELIWREARTVIAQEIATRRTIQAELDREYPLRDFLEIYNNPNRKSLKGSRSFPGS